MSCFSDAVLRTHEGLRPFLMSQVYETVETAKKLTVNTYHYFYDRISQTNAMPSLASLIKEKSRGLAIIS